MKFVFLYSLAEQKLVVRESKGQVIFETQCSLEEAQLILERDYNFPNAFGITQTPSATTGNEQE